MAATEPRAGRSGLSASRPSRSAGTASSASAIIAGTSKARVNFESTGELHRQFKSATAAEGTSIKDVLTDYMRRYVDGERP